MSKLQGMFFERLGISNFSSIIIALIIGYACTCIADLFIPHSWQLMRIRADVWLLLSFFSIAFAFINRNNQKLLSVGVDRAGIKMLILFATFPLAWVFYLFAILVGCKHLVQSTSWFGPVSLVAVAGVYLGLLQIVNKSLGLNKGAKINTSKISFCLVALIITAMTISLVAFLQKENTKNVIDNPKSANDYIVRANVYLAHKQYNNAIADLSMAVKLFPKNTFCYSDRAAAYQYSGQYNKATDDCSTALCLDPRNKRAYEIRGMADIGLRHYDKAIDDCSKALDLEPEDAIAFAYRGQAYEKLGQHELSVQDINKAKALGYN